MALYARYRVLMKGYKYNVHQYFVGTLQEIAAMAPPLPYRENRLRGPYL